MFLLKSKVESILLKKNIEIENLQQKNTELEELLQKIRSHRMAEISEKISKASIKKRINQKINSLKTVDEFKEIENRINGRVNVFKHFT